MKSEFQAVRNNQREVIRRDIAFLQSNITAATNNLKSQTTVTKVMPSHVMNHNLWFIKYDSYFLSGLVIIVLDDEG